MLAAKKVCGGVCLPILRKIGYGSGPRCICNFLPYLWGGTTNHAGLRGAQCATGPRRKNLWDNTVTRVAVFLLAPSSVLFCVWHTARSRLSSILPTP